MANSIRNHLKTLFMSWKLVIKYEFCFREIWESAQKFSNILMQHKVMQQDISIFRKVIRNCYVRSNNKKYWISFYNACRDYGHYRKMPKRHSKNCVWKRYFFSPLKCINFYDQAMRYIMLQFGLGSCSNTYSYSGCHLKCYYNTLYNFCYNDPLDRMSKRKRRGWGG